METKLEVHRSKTLAEATEIAWKVFICARLWISNSFTCYMCMSESYGILSCSFIVF